MKKYLKYYLQSYVRIFLIVAFFVTSNFVLFLHFAPLDYSQLHLASRLTLVNVLLMSGVFAFIGMLLHHHGVDVPVKHIQNGIDQIMQGDFDVRIPYLKREDSQNEFDQIIKGLNHMARELGSVETLRTDFISNVSHELKTPLTVIQNYSTLLQMPDLPEDKRLEYTKGIVYQTKKMSHMFSNILKLSKLENQQFQPNAAIYNLGEQLCECMLLYEEVWEQKNMIIETDIEENVLVFLDEELMSQVWINLISNAVKFTDEGDKISLILRADDGKAVVMLRDSGYGMKEETLKHIFNKFYQGDTSHATPGNGLGLPLVKSILNVSNGEIYVHSKEGVGSAFTVVLDRII